MIKALRPGAPRFMRTAIAVLSAASLGGVAGAQQAPIDNWAQFRGNARLTGIAAGAPPPAQPALRWTYQAGEAIDASPAIADGSVYVATSSGDLIAIDLASGKLRWKYTTGGIIGESSPAVGGGQVVFGDLGGTVHAVSATDGSKRWTFKTGGEVKSSPTLAGDLVLIGSYDTHLYALDSRTGKVRWKLQTDGPVHATAAVHGDIVYITGCDEKLRGLRLATGAVVFTLTTGAYTGASTLVADNGNWAYFGTFNYEVLGVDLRTKKIAWRYRNPNREFPFYSSASMADGRVIVGGRDKNVHAIDAVTGKGAWTFATKARVDSSPAIAGGRVYIGSADGRLYGLDAKSGQKQWEFDAGAGITSSPAIAAGRIVVGTEDGRVYCFG
jgi:outer membrane protein assembly factor BamB